MSDGTDDYNDFGKGLDGVGDPDAEGVDEDPPSYHSGRVRIIGAEPAGDAMREVTGPVADEHPELPHWNDEPITVHGGRAIGYDGRFSRFWGRADGEEPGPIGATVAILPPLPDRSDP